MRLSQALLCITLIFILLPIRAFAAVHASSVMPAHISKTTAIYIGTVAQTHFIFGGEQRFSEESLESARKFKTYVERQQQRRAMLHRIDLIFIISVIATLFLAALFNGHRERWKRKSIAIAWLLSGCLAGISMAVSVYYDFHIGSTSAYARSGAYLTAQRDSVMFWIIATGKLVAAGLFVMAGGSALRRRSVNYK